MAEQIPGWHPDPSGRHQHRFWDGTAWTDAVSDGGTVGSDPQDLRFAGLPRATDTTAEGVTVTRRSKWPFIAVAAVVAVLVLAGGFVLLDKGDEDKGTGATIEKVEPGQPITRTVHLRTGEAVGFEVRAPNKDVRFRVAIAVDVGTGMAIQRTFGSDSDAYGDDLYAAFFPDGGGRQEHRLLFAGRMRGFYAESFVAPATGDYTLVVRAEEAARVRIDIETMSKPGLEASYSPVGLYRLRRDKAYKTFFEEWDHRSQGDVSAFTDFSDPYSDEQTDQMSDYFSEYSDYVDTDYSGYTGESDTGTSS